MAPYKTKGRKNKHRRSCFFCCFGSFKQQESNILSNDHDDGQRLTSGISKKSSRRGTQTVLISDSTFKTVIKPNKEIFHVVVEQEDAESMNNKLLIESTSRGVILNKEMVPERNKSLNESGRAAQESRSGPMKLSHSVSLPLLQRKKEKTSSAGQKGKELVGAAGELDPIVGALIIMVALVVMLIWGKLCAILCTTVWFYFIPRFKSNHVVKLENDLDSVEYKNKVVLQGFLDRSHV